MSSCPLCGHDTRKRMLLPHATVRECLNSGCRLKFAFPQLESQSLDAAYRKFYYPDSETGIAVYENTPEEILRQTFDRAEAEFGPLAGKRLLDFGCGVGRLCQIAREYGMDTAGIEADANARVAAGKTGSLRAYANLADLRGAEPGTRFDIVTMWDVIEHLREPWRELKELCNLLRSSGWLLLSTPNAGSLRAFFLREHWENAVNPTHFYYFTRQPLRLTLERGGFCDVTEWRFPIRYPGRTTIRRMIHLALATCRLQGQFLFFARPRILPTAGLGQCQ